MATAIFQDAMEPGIVLDRSVRVASTDKQYPDYLEINRTVRLEKDSRIDPSQLAAQCAYIYGDNLYITDDKGNIAYIDCEMRHTINAAEIR